MPPRLTIQFDFHISRAARAKYRVDTALFSLRGSVVFANFYAARLLALNMNAARDPSAAVQAGELNALGLIHEILQYVLQQYRAQRGDVMARAVERLYADIGADAVETTLRRFVNEFPPLTVYRAQETVDEYLRGTTDGIANREIVLEELLLVWLENQNPAAIPFKELFDDTPLARETAYPAVVRSLQAFFAEQEPFGPERQTLIDALLAPTRREPASLAAQLNYMLYRWSAVAGRVDVSRFLARALGGLQFIREEQQFLFARQTAPFGGGGFTATTPPVPTFHREFARRADPATGREIIYEPEPEQFSMDLDWMPRIVLLAKSTYVWLDQLSKKYGHALTRLDQIPDAELDELAQRGITGLWFIGVWERSRASARIKHAMGNSGAMASAYSLYDYEIARELGGAEALEELKARAWLRGIRLASDMVPNHMGIDSRWVMERPDWFVQSRVPPYPSYSFTGMDLSSTSGVTVQIEDHYWNHSDAAVVFKRTEHATGDVRYIYHGNDGTSFPWNDTAQLDYLQAQVREHVIQAILRVARQFPVIRFDAAMTLAKKHFERLWYPLPGERDTIPSRGEYSMTRAELDALMPEEFWREAVDRVAAEAPETLLLAEAFWLMEGYFVRTLGMHRVYNSAFMHMLRDEKNLEYRLVIKNTLEFDPEVLKRYVNFMNNPDERTAVDQFGKGDKYFGVCVLMATMPGLPMFGHGQIEGLSERYGMEFRAPMLDEAPDAQLIERHAREVFSLLHKRYLFAGVENFLLYDLFRSDGSVQENVFAYSNRYRSERTLIAYNNSYRRARGKLRVSAAFRDKDKDALVQRTLAEGLNLRDEENTFLIFREHMRDEEFIRRPQDLIRDGFALSLDGYQYAVYLDFREVADAPDHSYARLHDRLHGRGVPNVERARLEMNLEPLHAAFRQLLTPREPDTLAADAGAFVSAVNAWTDREADPTQFAKALTRRIAENARAIEAARELKSANKSDRAAVEASRALFADAAAQTALRAFAIARTLDTLAENDGAQTAAWLDEWQLGRVIAEQVSRNGASDARAWQLAGLVRIGLSQAGSVSAKPGAQNGRGKLEALLNDANVAQFLNVNRFDNVLWFNKEAFDALVDWLELTGDVAQAGRAKTDAALRAAWRAEHSAWDTWRAAEAESEYRVEKLLAAFAPAAKKSTARVKQVKAQTRKRAAPKPKSKPKRATKPSKATTAKRATTTSKAKTEPKRAPAKQVAPKKRAATKPKQAKPVERASSKAKPAQPSRRAKHKSKPTKRLAPKRKSK